MREAVTFSREQSVPQFFVKSPVFPLNKFPGVDAALGPEMRSTGEPLAGRLGASGA